MLFRSIERVGIDPALIEDALLAHPDVTAAAAVARPDAHSGEVPVAFVAVRPGATVTGDELTAFVNKQVADYKALAAEFGLVK